MSVQPPKAQLKAPEDRFSPDSRVAFQNVKISGALKEQKQKLEPKNPEHSASFFSAGRSGSCRRKSTIGKLLKTQDPSLSKTR